MSPMEGCISLTANMGPHAAALRTYLDALSTIPEPLACVISASIVCLAPPNKRDTFKDRVTS